MTCFGQISADWIVAWNLASMGVIASKGPRDLHTRRQNGTIYVNRQCSSRQVSADNGGIELPQGLHALGAELLEPITQRTFRRQIPKPAKAFEDRIFFHKCDVSQSPTSDNQ